MKVRKVAGLLAAAVVALGVNSGVAGAAPATPTGGAVSSLAQVPNGEWVELYLPFVTPTRPHCLEGYDRDHNGFTYQNRTANCHASDGHGDNQLWEFISLGDNTYWLINEGLPSCLVLAPPASTYLGHCTGDGTSQWRPIQSAYDPNGFELQNVSTGACLSSDGIPAPNGTGGLHLWGCFNPPYYNGDVQIQTWRVG